MSGKPLGNPVCGNCCRDGMGCDGCAKCLPRYLCIHADVTLGPYFECPEDPNDPDFVCCPTIDFRIGGGCPEKLDDTDDEIPDPPGEGNPGWAGSGTCHESCVFASTSLFGTIADVTLSVDVRIIKIDGQCYTRVWSSTVMTEPLFFPGVLGWNQDEAIDGCQKPVPTQSEIRFSGYDIFGTFFDAVLRVADVFVNPRALDKCSGCQCATCLPKSLCVTLITIAGNLLNGPSLVFTCTPDPEEPKRIQWLPPGGEKLTIVPDYGPPVEYDVRLWLPTEEEAIADASLRGCFILGQISGGGLETVIPGNEYDPPTILPFHQFLIPLERQLRQPPFPELPIDGVKCREPLNQWDSLNKSGGTNIAVNVPKIRTLSIVDFTEIVSAIDSLDIRVTDAACGGLCRVVQNVCFHPCCPRDQVPSVIFVTMSVFNGVDWINVEFEMYQDLSFPLYLTYRGNEPADYGSLGPDWGLQCRPLDANSGWQWILSSGTRRISESAASANCSPFEIIFDSYTLLHAEITA